MKPLKFFTGIKKNVIILGLGSFFTDISSEMLYPVIPIFLTSVIGAPVSVMGLIEGLAESTASILKGLSGWLSDKIGKRRIFVVSGYSLSAISKPLLYIAYGWPLVLVARFLDRFGKGIRTSARDAMIAETAELPFRGKAFGFHRAMDSFGAFLGPIAAILLLAHFKDNIRPIFLIAFIPGALCVLTLAFFLKETRVPLADAKKVFAGIKAGPFGPNFKRLLFATSIFAIGNSSDAFLIIRSKDLGLSMIMVIVAYTLYNLVYSVFSAPFGAVSDRVPKKNVIIIGYAVFAAIYIAFALAASSWVVWILFPVYGLYMALTDGVGKALVSEMVAPERVGTAMGLYHFVLGIFTFFASLVAGLLWTRVGPAATFYYGAVMAMLSCAAFMLLVKEK